LKTGKSHPVTLPYSPKISSRCPLETFFVNPPTTTTLNPVEGAEPFVLTGEPAGEREREGDREIDMDISLERERRGEAERGFGERERPRPDMVVRF